ncbi:hypothetical protein [Sulfurimonas sp.]
MFSRFKQRGRVVLLDPQSSERLEYSKGQKISIILSPSLYWIKKIAISVKYLRELKKLLPSIFEESLPEGNYSYEAYKSQDGYFAFAYEDRKIIELLKSKGIELSDVLSIHFAQSEFSHLQEPHLLNEKQALTIEDGVVILTPKDWYENLEPINLDNIQLSNHTITLQQFSHIVDNKSLYKIGYLLLFLALILIVELFIAKGKLATVEQAKASVFKEYKLKSTMMQNRAILQKYEKIDTKQRALREYISYFLKMKLPKEASLTRLEYNSKTLIAYIRGVSKQKEKQLLQAFIKNKVAYKATYKDKELRVEVKL